MSDLLPPKPFERRDDSGADAEQKSDLPLGFKETILRVQVSRTGQELGILASIIPEQKDLTAASLVTQDIPLEHLSRQGRQAIFSDVGDLQPGPPIAVAQYEVLKILGRGGMSVVCSARQKSLQREVALKVSIPVAGPGASVQPGLEQFTNEACVTAGLDHPNVVPVYSLARDPTGRMFFAMKRVTGVSWEELLNPRLIRSGKDQQIVGEQSRHLTFEDHLDIWVKVADAAAYAHSKQVIHRDLKPENVMIGSFGEVLLVDWGLAMTFGERNPYRMDPNKKPQLAGTPGYLAPEMAQGKMTRLGPATDVYMLGGILYRLLTGKPPHAADSIAAAVHRAARGEVDPIEKTESGETIDPEISRIVMKALSKKMEDRYSSVQELQEEVRIYRANSRSLAVTARALEMLRELRAQVGSAGGDDPEVKHLGKDQAAVVYGKLSEAIGSFHQAVALWPGNQEAIRGRLIARTLQVRLALDQGDLTLARSQLDEAKQQLGADFSGRAERLGEELSRRQRQVDALARRATLQRWLVGTIILLLVVGVAGAFVLLNRQKQLAQENLRITDVMHRKMFAQAVSSHAATVEQYLQDVEQVVAQYRDEAVRLLDLPPQFIPPRPRTRAGRDGYTLDQDYYDPATRPDDVQPSARYGFPVSLSQTTAVLAPWAQQGEARERALEEVLRLSRLSDLFAHVQASRRDIVWSLTGTQTGALVSFPGSGRFRDKPTYDPTNRPWYLGALDASDDRPGWRDPHIDAGGQGLIISCTSPLRSGGKLRGVIGVELALESLQTRLLEFTRQAGAGTRGLLVQADGKVIVDTSYHAGSTGWKENFDLIAVADAGPELARYFQDILAGKVDSASAREIRNPGGAKLLGYARLKHPDWVLIVQIDRGMVE
jgi:serine/threonine protein kinase